MRAVTMGLVLGMAAPAAAEVVAVAPAGMEIRQVVSIAAAPQKVWDTFMVPARWWSSDHSFSGAAENITIDPRVGGCWCEELPNGGGVVHMEVTHIAPPKTVVFRGAMGPFYNQAVDGALSISLTANGTGTDITLVYRASGYVKDGFEKWAGIVDAVFAQQMGNLKKHLETAS